MDRGVSRYAFINFAVGNDMEGKFPEFLEDMTKSSEHKQKQHRDQQQ